MALVKIQNPQGDVFFVSGAWLYEENSPTEERIAGGMFHIEVRSRSVTEALEKAERLIQKDIIVMKVQAGK